jgi:hypothetical protein
MTGLSMGGGLCLDFGSYLSGARLSKVAAMVLMCPSYGYNSGVAASFDSVNMPMKFYHDSGDPQVAYSISTDWVSGLNGLSISPPATLTTFNNNVHNAWDEPSAYNYDSGSGLNVWQWLLSKSRINLVDITFGTNIGPMNNSSGIWSAGNTSVGGYNLNKGLSAKKLPAGQSGRIQMQYVSGGSCILGFNTANSNDNPSTYEAAAYLEFDALYKIDGGTITSLAYTMTANHYVAVVRNGSVIKIQTSPDGINWTDRSTLTFSSTADLFICGALDSTTGSRMHYPKGVNIS